MWLAQTQPTTTNLGLHHAHSFFPESKNRAKDIECDSILIPGTFAQLHEIAVHCAEGPRATNTSTAATKHQLHTYTKGEKVRFGAV
jgi:hypothetical protein